MLGPPATGKGTQAALLSSTFGISAASTGAMLRDELRRGTELGRQAAEWTKRGELFPDTLALDVVWAWLKGRTRFIFDGFPRTVGQARAFDAGLSERGLPLDVVYFLDLPEQTILDRMSSRVTCRACGSVYNEIFHKVAIGDACPTCRGELYRRDDDTTGALRRRMEQYREFTLPVAEYYRGTGLLKPIDATPGRDAVFATLYEDILERNRQA